MSTVSTITGRNISLLQVAKPPKREFSFSSPRKRALSYQQTKLSRSSLVYCRNRRKDQKKVKEHTTPNVDDVVLSTHVQDSGSLLSPGGCKGCGKEVAEIGCNGEGRIQGGIATIPGFGWWPIKAYRPCPSFLDSGGKYRRRGQSMDEIASGTGKRGHD
ncbi:unnamed protein product [Cuscuta campestris]|uniref:Uncharacterized protein n=1 Tax=Cuscuta campestris TaxID=132261 RepID=A0A484KVA1_9ASTE|nr:unnamed protein product [Cuscuta campestris]